MSKQIFWSLTMHDDSYFFVPTSLYRYSVNSPAAADKSHREAALKRALSD